MLSGKGKSIGLHQREESIPVMCSVIGTGDEEVISPWVQLGDRYGVWCMR